MTSQSCRIHLEPSNSSRLEEIIKALKLYHISDHLIHLVFELPFTSHKPFSILCLGILGGNYAH